MLSLTFLAFFSAYYLPTFTPWYHQDTDSLLNGEIVLQSHHLTLGHRSTVSYFKLQLCMCICTVIRII